MAQNERTKRQLNSNQTPVRANETKNKYHRFLNRAKSEKLHNETTWTQEIAPNPWHKTDADYSCSRIVSARTARAVFTPFLLAS